MTRPHLVHLTAVTAMLAATACAAGSPRTATPDRAAAAHAALSLPGRAIAAQPSAGCHRVVVAAGDIVNRVDVADRTGRLAAAQHPNAVLALGDNQYNVGALAAYRTKYDRISWGRLKPVTHPVPGNHEYLTRGAAGYFAYFRHLPAYYAYDAGCGWRGYALNSEIPLNPQVAWLRRDLAAHPAAAVLASWHKPRWSSGTHHGSDASMQPFWTALAGRRGVVLNGHEHNYERLAPVRGLREFVAGTGGSSSYPFGVPVSGSERRIAHTPGVLRLDLQAGGAYHWSFLGVDGKVLDRGAG